jgi:hypothetical protein
MRFLTMKKYLTLIVAAVVGASVLAPLNMKGAGAEDAIMPKVVTTDEAAKKYPPAAGKTSYPEGTATSTTTGGFFQSPYSSHVYDCRKVKKGALILDESAKKVFVRP